MPAPNIQFQSLKFPLQIEHAQARIVFRSKEFDKDLATSIRFTNGDKKRILYKITTADNSMFRVLPIFGALKPGESTKIKFGLVVKAAQPLPPNGRYFFAIHILKENDEKKSAAFMFNEYKGKPDGYKRIYVDFECIGKGLGQRYICKEEAPRVTANESLEDLATVKTKNSTSLISANSIPAAKFNASVYIN